MSFFRKALKYLEEIEPHVKLVTEQQYIDYHFSGLEDDDGEDAVNDGDHDSKDDSESHDGELSFDHGQNEPEYVSANSMEVRLLSSFLLMWNILKVLVVVGIRNQC